jgi:hypothetical protein
VAEVAVEGESSSKQRLVDKADMARADMAEEGLRANLSTTSFHILGLGKYQFALAMAVHVGHMLAAVVYRESWIPLAVKLSTVAFWIC